MTTLYRPVLIESAEQAEALPDDAIVISDGGDRYRRSGKDWMGVAGELPSYLDVDLLCNERITALVPIEAEETRDEGTGWIVPTAFGPKLMGAYLGRPDDTPAKRYTQTIWRTHWTPTEEA